MRAKREMGFGNGDLGIDFLSEEKTKASKDIAESPTAIAGTPKKKDEGQKAKD